jgi:hypothetical protein
MRISRFAWRKKPQVLLESSALWKGELVHARCLREALTEFLVKEHTNNLGTGDLGLARLFVAMFLGFRSRSGREALGKFYG